MNPRLALIALCLVVATTAFAQRGGGRGPLPDPLVRENATVQLAPHTYVIPDNNVPLVPNVGIVVGTRATLIVDPGLGRRNGETVLREAEKIRKGAELYVASTHFHVEHTTGIDGLPVTATYVSSSIQEEDFARGGLAQVKTFSSRSPLTAEILKDATSRKADIVFDREYRLDLGGVQVRMTVVGPTHTRGDTVIFVEGDNVLFAGDVVMNNSFVAANDNSSMKSWLAAFDMLGRLGVARVVPAHGEVGTGALIGVNRAFMQEIDVRARALKAQGRAVDEAATTIQMEMVAKHPDWARANGAAGAARAAYREAP
jgi:glyoxylase-like metal-dependent hydrolase (beta-lactamase superfamily II)